MSNNKTNENKNNMKCFYENSNREPTRYALYIFETNSDISELYRIYNSMIYYYYFNTEIVRDNISFVTTHAVGGGVE